MGSILSGFGSFFSGLFTGNFLAGLQGLFSGVITGIGQIASGFVFAFNTLHLALLEASLILGQSLPIVGGFFTLANTSLLLGTLELGFILQGTGVLLEKIGVSPKISQSLVAGGKIAIGVGLLAAGNPLGIAASLGLAGSGTSELLNLHTNLSPTISNIIGIGASALGAFAVGGINTSTLSGALAGLKTSLPYLSMDLASSGLTALGSRLGLDPRITALISVPIRASVGSITGNALGLPGYKDVLGNITSQTLGGLVSVGAAVGLDALEAPPIATNFISNFLGSIAAGLAGGSSGGGGPGDIQANGQSILSKIGEGLQKFGRGIVNAVGNVTSFGQKIIEGVGNVTVQGFKKAVSAFSSIFNRQTQEGIYQDEAGLKGAAVTQNGDIWTWQNGDSRIDYNTQTGETVETFGVGGKAQITGLGQDEAGTIFHQKLTYETVVGGGATLRQEYGDGHLTEWGYYYGGDSIMRVESIDGRSWQVEDGWLDGSRVEIKIPPIEIPAPEDEPTAGPSIFGYNFFGNLVFKFDIFGGKVEAARVDVVPGPAVSSQESVDINKDLFVITNGIGNWVNERGDYLRNLQMELFNASRALGKPEAVNPIRDVIVAPSFIPSRIFVDFLRSNFGDTVLADLVKKMYDMMDLVNEQRTGAQLLASQVKSAMEAFFRIFGDVHRERPIIGVGYSGGFVPVVDGIENGNYEYDVNAYVALGGTTVAIGAEAARLIVQVIEAFENVATARTEDARAAYAQVMSAFQHGFEGLGSLLAEAAGSFVGVLGLAYSLLGQSSINQAADAFYNGLQVFIQGLSGLGWGMPGAVDAKMMVNIFGTKDLLATKTGLVGYRAEWAGFSVTDRNKPLFNIEIEGADHFDYIYGVDPTKTGDAFTRNEIVARYVAEIVLNSDNLEQLRIYLDKLVGERFAVKTGLNDYRLTII